MGNNIISQERVYWDNFFSRENIKNKISQGDKFWTSISYPEFIEVKKNLKDLKNKRVLSIGCGTGLHELFFLRNGAFVDYTDISIEALKWQRIITKDFKKTRFIQCNAEKLPFISNSYDIVFAHAAIHHIKNKEKLFKKVSKILKKDGIAFFIDSYTTPLTDFLKRTFVYKVYKRRDISPVDEVMTEQGLKEGDVLKFNYYFSSMSLTRVCLFNKIYRRIFKKDSIILNAVTRFEIGLSNIIPSIKKNFAVGVLICKK